MLFGNQPGLWPQPLAIKKMKPRTIRGHSKRAACLISGAFRVTAAEALNTKLHLPPIAIHVNRLVKETAVRLRAGSELTVPSTMVRRRRTRKTGLDGHRWRRRRGKRADASRLSWEL